MTHAHTTVMGKVPDTPPSAPIKDRFMGVDVGRGVALLAMLGANVSYVTLTDDDTVTLSGMTVIGRSATLFVMVAGISLAFISGGRRPVQGTARRAARANIAVRALLIGLIGLALSYVAPPDLGVILTYYGVFFLLAIPLIGLRPRILIGIAGALVVAGPLVLMAASYWDWPAPFDSDPTLSAPFTDPLGLLLQLLVTGTYPAVVYMAYICVGLAIGRLDLSSPRVALRLLVGGLALALAAWSASWLLLERLGGLQALLTYSGPGTTPNQIIWDGELAESWWWLATRVHHSGAPLDMLHTLGSAMAVLGAVLLLTRLSVARRLLRPVALAGAMTLTVYSAHAFVLGSSLRIENELALYLALVGAALVFAVLWHRWLGQGPLERLVAIPADRARAAVLAGRFPPRSAPSARGATTSRPPVPGPRDPLPPRDRRPGQ
ncbi:heparan-alpha-glucosaminide N-acetyltransferase domain-containing protein [Geodermatophilus sabuli]|uniref:Uncharacterized membrane protein YeiB n=1 Tax=Geodermatophilus sabuli TaxID=1564158 RepID=A0A285EJ61_9ACTN|nr:heparan-alpha-glucosaminide N-acetyltransferase domain-containing protein [Geodermatophilus sabuli]MBB3086730.1 putative membrane protein YeiB [Geodermatophilus sabuli]SNX98893.1 Uncharacterized membrane protein YeiB [Geodermatophilus sabuli]